MSDVVKEDGVVADLSAESLAILGVGEEVTEEVVGSVTDDMSTPDDILEGAGTAEAVQDADADVSDTGPDPAVGQDGDGGAKDGARWYGDDDIELAASYKLTPGQLDAFDDADDFRKHAMFFDASLKQPAAGEPEPKQEEPPVADAEQIEIDPEWYASEGYGEPELKIVKAVQAANRRSDELARELAEMRAATVAEQERLAEERQRAEVDAFHTAVDALRDEWFGDTVKNPALAMEAESEAGRRRFRLFSAIRKYGDAFGDVSMRAKVTRAMNLEFGDELRARDKRVQAEKIAGQSRRRRPVAATSRMQRAVKDDRRPPENPNDVSDILGDQDFQAQWESIARTNGSQ